MKLSKRQESFIRDLLDLYRDLEEPLHYTDLAERLKVSKYTAYYLLRLLEERGYVESIYEDRGKRPGRAAVLYQPTQKARATFLTLSSGADEDWSSVQSQILNRVQDGEFEDNELADDILSRLPGSFKDDVDYCTGIIGALTTRLKTRSRHRVMAYYFSTILGVADKVDTKGIRMLAGFILGMSAEESDEAEIIVKLMEYAKQYEQLVDGMDRKARERLVKSLTKVMTSMKQSRGAEQ